MKKILNNIVAFFTNRLLLIFFIFIVMFSFVVQRLFDLQIVQGITFNREIKPTSTSDTPINASRGEIFDRYGRPLAVNEIAYTLNINNTVSLTNEERNTMIINLIDRLDKNGETLIDQFPMSKTKPYTFLFNGSKDRENRWKMDMGIEDDEEALNCSPDEMIEYLTDLFDLPENLPDDTFRKLISLRSIIFENRFRTVKPITIALDISEKTVVDIEEENMKFPSVYVDVDSLRRYPEGKYFANMLGYIRFISDKEYSQYKEYGYENNDLIGKLGIEKSMELQLKGEKGKKFVEVNAAGKSTGAVSIEEPTPGNNVFLTIDKEFQKEAYDILERELSKALIERLDAKESGNTGMQIPLEKLFSSMVMSNNISLEAIFEGEGDSVSYKIGKLIRENFRVAMNNEKTIFINEKLNELEPDDTEKNKEYLDQLKTFDRELNIAEQSDMEIAKQILANDIEVGKITKRDCVLMLYEQDIITLDDKTRELLTNGLGNPLQIVTSKVAAGEITPQMANLDPCTGSLCVVDVHTGEVLALVTYPSYDNNYLVNSFDYDYFNKISNDPTIPMLNRPLVERKAPGSTFKMITAIAGLEMKLITPHSLISDLGIFTKAGLPGARCWLYKSNNATHGPINVAKALEVSCNYFFYDISYNLSTSPYSDGRSNIAILNEYMTKFGMDSFSGIEIDEEYRPMMASPENKYKLTMAINPDATESQTRWTEGDTIRSAIGQSNNNYAPVHMAKYLATLANGGTRYKVSVIDKITTNSGTIVEDSKPEEEYVIDIDSQNLKAVFEGMLAVTSGNRGSLRKVFEGFDIPVAAKSGTAQQNAERPSHTWFVGFAPYDKPEIAIAVLVPFGEASMSPAAITGRELVRYYMQPGVRAQADTLDNKMVE